LSDWKDKVRKEEQGTDGPDKVEEVLRIKGIRN
jgi:hypothetical protein